MRIVALILLFISCWLPASTQITYNEVWVDYDSAVDFRNLKVIPVRKKDNGGPDIPLLSFSNALQSNKITVSERGTASTENVHWLRVNNNSGEPVYISSGEVVLGGRQDRMITKDTILESMNTDQYIPVMCVEENRWSEKEKKFRYASFANPRLRKVLDHSKNQVLVWKEIYNQLDSGNIKSPTLAYAAGKADKKQMTILDEYLKHFFEKIILRDSNIVGFVCMTGNRIIGSDIYSGHAMFHDQFITLLTGYAEEAINFGSRNQVDNNTVKDYLDKFLTDEPAQTEYLSTNGKIFRRQGKVFQLSSY